MMTTLRYFFVIKYWIKKERSNLRKSIQNLRYKFVARRYKEYGSADHDGYLSIKEGEIPYDKMRALDGFCMLILKTILVAGKKRKNYINSVLKEDVDDETPQDIIDLILSYLHDKVTAKTLEQAEFLEQVENDFLR